MGADVWVILAIGVVLIFGATKLPQIARNLGKAQGEFKKGLKEGAVDGRRADAAAGAELDRPTDGGRPAHGVTCPGSRRRRETWTISAAARKHGWPFVCPWA
jgi:sec-independent protein translocase protein TatA